MRARVEDMTTAELEALVTASGASLGRRFLEELEKDSRAGVAKVAARLRRLQGGRRRESARQARRLALERRHWSCGVRLVAGVDEVGMGPLAGPVVAAAVILDPDAPVREADDSKKLDGPTRQRLEAEIRQRALAVAVGVASVEEIGASDVYRAGLLAMRRAVESLAPAPEVVLVDARTIPGVAIPQEAHVKGDAKSCSIAAASIVAKVHRDALMAELGAQHPGYGFERHAGYAVPEHLEALRRLGPSPVHRTSWLSVGDHGGNHSSAFHELRACLPSRADDLASWGSRVQAALAELSADEVRRLDDLARSRCGAGRRRRGREAPPSLPLA